MASQKPPHHFDPIFVPVNISHLRPPNPRGLPEVTGSPQRRNLTLPARPSPPSNLTPNCIRRPDPRPAMLRATRHLLRRTRLPSRRLCTPAREELSYDVVIVGAGPAGLSAAIRLRQLAEQADEDLSVCVLEKAAEVGGHVLSGNVFEPRAMDELLPQWRESAPLGVQAGIDRFVFLTEGREFPLPTPPQMKNHGNYIISLSEMTRWLGEQAEEAGVEVYPGFAASEVLYKEDGSVRGVATNDFGIAKDGSKKDNYQPGIEIVGRVSLLAEGARGSLTKAVESRFGLREGKQHQTYALGLKEVWQVDPAKHEPGKIVHSIGYPMDLRTYGGSFLYHMTESRVAIGFVVALDYENPYLSPFQEFQRYKAHPSVRPLLEGGEVLQYGARTLNEGGLQSIPKLEFEGGALIGCAAGFVNVPKIKGAHTAQKSGMLAAEAVFENLREGRDSAEGYEERLRQSWVWDELSVVRNIRPGFKYGLLPGLANAALESYVTRGRSPWTISHGHADHLATKPAIEAKQIEYPKPDGKVTFDILTSLSLSGTDHDHDERCHLVLKDDSVPEKLNLPLYDGPESRFCPAKVYEYVEKEADKMALQINAQNCLHCKACDIKDPSQNIEWTVPQGGGGPKYTIT